MTGRYVITRRPAATHKPWAIYDAHLAAFCTLLADGRNLLPLEWASRVGAETWLFQCRLAWLSGQVPMPDGAGARHIKEVVREGKEVRRRPRWE